MELCQHFHYKWSRGVSQGFSTDCSKLSLPFSKVWDRTSSPKIVPFPSSQWHTEMCHQRSLLWCIMGDEFPVWSEVCDCRFCETQVLKELAGLLSNSVAGFGKSSQFSQQLSQRFLVNPTSVDLYGSASQQYENPPCKGPRHCSFSIPELLVTS